MSTASRLALPTILIVTDNCDALAAESPQVTAGLNARILHADLAPLALDMMEQDAPSILVIDWDARLPGGQRACVAVRARSDWQHIHVIVVAAPRTVDDLMPILQTGADDVVIKPINPAMLRARIEMALRIMRIKNDRATLEQRQSIFATITTVAHEINNPLFAVMGNLALLREELGELGDSEHDEFVRECLDTMAKESQRIASVVRRLQAITKPSIKTYMGNQQMIELPTESRFDIEKQ